MKIEAEKVEQAFHQYKKLLTPKEQEVITRYYGIRPNVRHSLREIGTLFGVTRERIRQIKSIALKKMHLENLKETI